MFLFFFDFFKIVIKNQQMLDFRITHTLRKKYENNIFYCFFLWFLVLFYFIFILFSWFFQKICFQKMYRKLNALLTRGKREFDWNLCVFERFCDFAKGNWTQLLIRKSQQKIAAPVAVHVSILFSTCRNSFHAMVT